MADDTSTATERVRKPRRDAVRNRAALIDAAKALLAEEGIDISLERVAKSAGLGIATLYRHFPLGREQLIDEALTDEVAKYVELTRHALAHDDPWQGFCTLVEESCSMQEGNLGLGDILGLALARDAYVEAQRREANELVQQVIARAQAGGKLRPDFVPEDLLMFLIANSAVVSHARQDAPRASPRFAALFLAAAAVRPSRRPLPEPPSGDDLDRAMRRRATSLICARSRDEP